MSLANLNRALLIGCVLVVLVLAVFLWDWRTAVISLTAIPLSLVAAARGARPVGGTLDTMVIAGLIIALGEVVDDAIIDVENIVRRLRLNRAAAAPRPAFEVVLDASLEVRSAVVYGSLIVVLVFLPVFFLDGLAGSFFRPLALAYVLAIAASLLVALIVTPALSLMLLPQAIHEREAPVVTRLKGRYRRVLPCADRARRGGRSASSRCRWRSRWRAFPFLGEEFLPHFKEYDFLMHWVEKPGTSLEAMRRITLRASEELRAVPGVRNFGAHIGRAEVADEVVGINFTELWISLDPRRRLRRDGGEDAGRGRRLSGPPARSADLPARAHQGSADRRQRDHRGPRLRSGPRTNCSARRPRSARRSAASTASPTSRCRRSRSCRRSRWPSIPTARSRSA